MIRFASLLALALLGGCATSSVVLLQGEDGSPGQLAVLDPRGGDEAVLDKPNSRASLGSRVAVSELGGTDVPEQYRELVALLPDRPIPFILYFPTNSAQIEPRSEIELHRMVDEIRRRGPGVDVEVIGHTDTMGRDAYNDELSLARAQKILLELRRQGILPAASRAVGRGERDLKDRTPDNMPDQHNRRVEVLVR